MGNLLGDRQHELSQSLRGQYQQSHPYLLHLPTNQLCTLHKLTTNSAPNSTRVSQIIEEYGRSKCESTSKLKAHYKLDKISYCSDQETYYLIFQGQNSYTLREEVVQRRFYHRQFKEEEIRQIVQTYLCGLRQYNHRFQRQYERLSLESLIIDQHTKKIYLRDPWLGAPPEGEHSDNLTRMMQTYPSPEKLNALHSPKLQTYNQFLSNLFSVGVISLELKRLNFADSIYTKKKQINLGEISRRVAQFKDAKLRKGIQILLQIDPNARKEVYMIWGIENREDHFLTPINEQKNMSQIYKQTQRPQPQPQQNLIATKKRTSNPAPLPPTPPKPLITHEVLPKQVESIYIPAMQLSTVHHGKSHPNIHFNRPLSQGRTINLQPVPPNSIPFSKQIEPFHLTKHEQTSKSFFNTTDNIKQQPQPHIVINQPAYLKFEPALKFEPSPKRPGRGCQFDTRALTDRPTYPISKEPSVQPNPYIFRESLIYYQPAPMHTSPDQTRRSNEPINIKTPATTDREIKLNPILDTDRSTKPQSKQTLTVPKKQSFSPKPQTSPQISRPIIRAEEHKLEQSPSRHPKNHTRQADSFLIKKQQFDHEKAITPHRPTAKNKYNSTIVEVRDQETPDHSAKSEDPLEEEYVVEDYQTGSRYQGYKSAGMRNGRGRFYYQDGGYYQGLWKNNKMDGFGKLYYEGGKLAYQGQWAQDEFNGQGKVYNDSPVPLQGTFDYTNFDHLEDYWQYYQGMLSKDTKEGRGRIKLSNGQTFEGDFHQDKIQGFGKFHTIQAKTIQGIWRESKLIKIISNA